MFSSTRRFEKDGCEWQKDDTLDIKFSELSEDCTFYVIMHWFLKCATTPDIKLIVDKEWLKEYIEKNVRAGDLLEIWGCTSEKTCYFSAKMPDENGLIPIKGTAY